VTQNRTTRVVIVGGGFGGVYTALHLEKIADPGVEITLISRDNYFLMTPLLFEAGSGILEPRHAVNPIRPLLTRARFVEAEVKSIDFENKSVSVQLASTPEMQAHGFDHLVLALGGITNISLVPGSEHALTFKTLGDAIFLRNQVIRLFEWADVEQDPARKRAQLTYVIVGAGLVGLELMGELNTFARNVADLYKNVDPNILHFELIEAGPQIAPEFDEKLANYSSEVLQKRGVTIRTNTPVKGIYPDRIELPDGTSIQAQTIIVATGVAPSPLLKSLNIAKDKKGRAVTEHHAGARHYKHLGPRRLRAHPRPRRKALPTSGPARSARGKAACRQYRCHDPRPPAPALHLQQQRHTGRIGPLQRRR